MTRLRAPPPSAASRDAPACARCAEYMQTNERRYMMDLELELVEHAEIIFTTLSSSGRNIFARMKDRKYMRIHTVLIDEACQVRRAAALGRRICSGEPLSAGRAVDSPDSRRLARWRLCSP